MFSQTLHAAGRQRLARLHKNIPKRLPEREVFLARLERHFPELLAGLDAVYGATLENTLERLLDIMVTHHAAREPDLRRLDLQRTLAPDWFERPDMIGYVCYTERFTGADTDGQHNGGQDTGGTLRGVAEKLPYLKDLGVRYLHLMPFLQPRPAPHDGGYAVQDYRAVRPDLGNMDDLAHLTAQLRQHGMGLCCDLVLNHVAQEHEWAKKAQAGDAKYQNYFFMHKDRAVPDAYEKTLPEIFPDFAPGNFTFDATTQSWVWTTFNTWQWDLNWANSDVFLEFADLILWLANKGVDVFRLDAIAFIWKRLGTDCQNQPEVHAITQALRAAVRVVAPAVLFKAEAIVSPDDLVHYLGRGQHHGQVSDLAYHNVLMVQIWSSLASRDTRLMTSALQAFPPKPSNTAWGAYLRCHDDIGWAVTDEDAARVGQNGFAHRRFLSDYYSGRFPGTHARGLVFQENKRTGDRRISGSAASLAGLEVALENHDERGIDLAVERLLLGMAVVLGWGGIPLLYMGDEIAMLNDHSYLQTPETAMDNRWVHRPRMDWQRAAHAHANPTSPEGRVYWGLRGLLAARSNTPHLHAGIESRALDTQNPHVFIAERAHPEGTMLCVYNFSEHAQTYPVWQLQERGLHHPKDRITGKDVDTTSGWLWLGPYARLWLTQ